MTHQHGFPWEDRPTTLYASDYCSLHPGFTSEARTTANKFDDTAVPATMPIIRRFDNTPHSAIHHWTMTGTGTREGQAIASGGVIAAGAAFPVPSALRTGTWRGSARVDFWRSDNTWQGGGMLIVRRTPAITPLSVTEGLDLIAVAALTGTQPQRIEFSGDYSRGAGSARKLRAGDPVTGFTWQIGLLQATWLPYGTRPRALVGYFAYGYDDIETARAVVRAYPEITEWQIWNEPDVVGVSGAAAAAAYIEFHAMVHEERPLTGVVRGPAQVTYNDYGIAWLTDFLNAGGGAGIDLLDEHWYNTGLGSLPTYRQLSFPPFDALLNAHGQQAKPRGSSELGNVFGDNYGMGTPGDACARFLVEYFLSIHNGATPEGQYLYKVPGNGDWDQPSWMMSFWGVPQPQLAMFIEAGRQLDPFDIRGTLEVFSWGSDPGDDFLLGGQVGGTSGGVAWLMSDGADYNVPLAVAGPHGGSVTVTDADGNDSTVSVITGIAMIPVTVYPKYITRPAGVTFSVAPLGFGTSLTSSATATMQGGAIAPSVIMPASQVVRGPYKDKVNRSKPNIGDGQSVYQSAGTPTTGAPLTFTVPFSDPATVGAFFVRSGRPWQDIGTILDADVQFQVDGDWSTVHTISQTMPLIVTGGSSDTDGHSSYFDQQKAWRFSWPVKLDTPISGVTGMRLLVREVSCGQAVDPEARNGYGELDEAGNPVVLESVRSDPPTLSLMRVRAYGTVDSDDTTPPPPVGTRRFVHRAA